jgi:hypothetical protein
MFYLRYLCMFEKLTPQGTEDEEKLTPQGKEDEEKQNKTQCNMCRTPLFANIHK